MVARSEAAPPSAARHGAASAKGMTLAMAGVVAGLGASSCCVIPFALFTLGVSGAWIGNLTALAPYQPVFLALALACLAAGYVLAYRRPKACVQGSACASPTSGRVVKAGLWTGTVIVVLAAGFPYLAPLFIDL
jgi:mercuric ion transport protein